MPTTSLPIVGPRSTAVGIGQTDAEAGVPSQRLGASTLVATGRSAVLVRE